MANHACYWKTTLKVHDMNAGGLNNPEYGERLIPKAKVLEMTSLSASSLVRMEDRGEFPKRRRLSKFRVAWVLSEVQEWIQSRIDAVA